MNPKKLAFATFIGLFLFVFATPAEATSVIRTGETVSVENDQKIEGDFYSMANILNVSGEIAGDMVSIGRKVTVNGSVTSDALLAGESVDVHGAIGDDVRVVAGDVVIAKPITGDLFVLAGSVTILSTASVGGDVILYSGEADISGSVGGNILGQVENLRIDAPVKGSIDVATGQLILGDKADIAGNVKYTSLATLERSPNAKMAGDPVRNDPVNETEGVAYKAFLVPLLMLLFSTLVWYLIAKQLLIRVTERALVRGIRPFATGFVFLFAAPVVFVVLIVSVLGSFVGVTALVAYLFAILLALFSMAAVLGQLLMYVYKKRFMPLSPVILVSGVAGIALLVLVPVLGPALLLALFMVTLGALVDVVLHPVR
ncbi:MAG: hypothetical protein RL538_17 [Candidatus Parcubacteria bacterium]|jgi:cytoskeletal protein CcmA (bactofilin family)